MSLKLEELAAIKHRIEITKQALSDKEFRGLKYGHLGLVKWIEDGDPDHLLTSLKIVILRLR